MVKKKLPVKTKKRTRAKHLKKADTEIQIELAPKNIDYIKEGKDTDSKKFIVRAPLELMKIVDSEIRYNGFLSRNDFVVQAIKNELNRMLRNKRARK